MEFKARDRRLEGDTPLRQCQLVQLYLLEVLDGIRMEGGSNDDFELGAT